MIKYPNDERSKWNKEFELQYKEWVADISMSFKETDDLISRLNREANKDRIKRRPIIFLIRANMESLYHILAHSKYKEEYYKFMLYVYISDNMKYSHENEKENYTKFVKEHISIWKDNKFIEKFVKTSDHDQLLENLLKKKISFKKIRTTFKNVCTDDNHKEFIKYLEKIEQLYSKTSRFLHYENKGFFNKRFSDNSPSRPKKIIKKYLKLVSDLSRKSYLPRACLHKLNKAS